MRLIVDAASIAAFEQGCSGCAWPERHRAWGAIVTRSCVTAVIVVAQLCGARASAQEYYNLDGNRPMRVEDATPTPRFELEFALAPLRIDAFAGGLRRWRSDNVVSYGAAAFTEIELRLPLLVVDARKTGGVVTSGVGGLGLAAMRGLRLETASLPAFAIAAEWTAPVGSLAAHVGTYSLKGLATKTFSNVRVHANVGGGTWAVRRDNAVPTCSDSARSTDCGLFIPDSPCDRMPSSAVGPMRGDDAERLREASATMLCIPLPIPTFPPSPVIDTLPRFGTRWLGGIGLDHAFALRSAVVGADVVEEAFRGLYPNADLSAEIGVRCQVTPLVVLDLGIARHFNGSLRSNGATIGLTYGLPVQRLGRGRREQ